MTVLLREAIGDRLRHARTNQRRTLRDISRAARVSLGYLSEVERGQKEASSELLASICDALELPLGELLHKVAAQLAAGARDRCGATWGLGLTGVAGPSAQDGVAPGTVHLGLRGPSGQTVRTLVLTGDRDAVRTGSVSAAFTLLEEQLD